MPTIQRMNAAGAMGSDHPPSHGREVRRVIRLRGRGERKRREDDGTRPDQLFHDARTSVCYFFPFGGNPLDVIEEVRDENELVLNPGHGVSS